MNVPLAIDLLSQAADQGDANAAKKAFRVLSTTDLAKGIKILKKGKLYIYMYYTGIVLAITSEDPELLRMLAQSIYQQNDPATAFGFWLEAAIKKDQASAVTVAECYHEGIGTQVDEKESLNWLMNSALLGNIDSAIKIAKIYRQKIQDLSEDLSSSENEIVEASLKFTLLAADNHDEDSILALGEAHSMASDYYSCWNLEKDANVSLGYFFRASNLQTGKGIGEALKLLVKCWEQETKKKVIYDEELLNECELKMLQEYLNGFVDGLKIESWSDLCLFFNSVYS